MHSQENDIATTPPQPLVNFGSENAMEIDFSDVISPSTVDIMENDSESSTCLEAAKEKLKRLQDIYGDSDAQVLSSMSEVALLSNRLGNHQDALLYETMVMNQLERDPRDEVKYLKRASSVAFYEAQAGYHRKACKRAEDVLKKQKELLPENHPHILETRTRLMTICAYLGHDNSVISQGNDIITILRKHHADPNRDRTQDLEMKELEYDVKSTQAGCFRTLQRYNEAVETQKEAVALCSSEELYGPEHPETLRAMSHLSLYLSDKGENNEAFEQEKQVLETCRRTIKEMHPVTINSKDHMALFLSRLGKHEEAYETSKEVLQARRKLLGEEHPDTLTAKDDAAMYCAVLEKMEEALELQKEALRGYECTLGEDYPEAIRLRGNLAYYSQTINPADALNHGERALLLSRRVHGESHPITKSLEEDVKLYRAEAARVPQASIIDL
jgi:tetratricopeptide (TPR) repeat protein